MWATLIQTVAAALRTALPTVIVLAYSDAPAPDEDTVYVKRVGSPSRSLFAQQSGTENLVLECWSRDLVPATADLKLQTLENNVIAALRTLPRVDPIVNLTITGIDPDGDLFRPNVGSQISITINWRVMRA
jgi:hypothetical protein